MGRNLLLSDVVLVYESYVSLAFVVSHCFHHFAGGYTAVNARIPAAWRSSQRRPEGIEKFDRFLDLAEEAGIYVHPTGPDHRSIRLIKRPDMAGDIVPRAAGPPVSDPAGRALLKHAGSETGAPIKCA